MLGELTSSLQRGATPGVTGVERLAGFGVPPAPDNPEMSNGTAMSGVLAEDIFRCGITLLELFTRETAYLECGSAAQVYRKRMRGEFPDCLSKIKVPTVRSFIEMCLLPPDLRPSATEVLQHPFLRTDTYLPGDRLDTFTLNEHAGGEKVEFEIDASPSEQCPSASASDHRRSSMEDEDDDNAEQSPDFAGNRHRSTKSGTISLCESLRESSGGNFYAMSVLAHARGQNKTPPPSEDRALLLLDGCPAIFSGFSFSS